MTLMKDIIKEAMQVLHTEENKNWISLKEIYRKVEEIRGVANPNGGATIRRTIETHSIASDVYDNIELFVSKEKGLGLYKLVEFMNVKDLSIGKCYSGKQLKYIYDSNINNNFIFSAHTKSMAFILNHNNLNSNSNIISDNLVEYVNNSDLEYIYNSLEIVFNKKYKIYLFETYKEDEYYFSGEVKITNISEILQENHQLSEIRCILKKKKNNNLIVNLEDIEICERKKLNKVRTLDKNKVRERAKKANSNKKDTREVKSTYRERNPYVSAYTKDRANGVCDLCGEYAPFMDQDNRPYLECHHLITLASDGPDVIYNTVALCPNCHKRMHILKSNTDINNLKLKIKAYLELENDCELINKFNDLFN